jgi:hypothetical protein
MISALANGPSVKMTIAARSGPVSGIDRIAGAATDVIPSPTIDSARTAPRKWRLLFALLPRST